MLTTWETILVAIASGGLVGGIAPLVVTHMQNRHARWLKLWGERKNVYSKILTEMNSLYSDERRINRKSNIRINQILITGHLLGNYTIYKLLIEYSDFIESEKKEYTKIQRQILAKKPISKKTWDEISQKINNLRTNITEEMRKDLKI